MVEIVKISRNGQLLEIKEVSDTNRYVPYPRDEKLARTTTYQGLRHKKHHQ